MDTIFHKYYRLSFKFLTYKELHKFKKNFSNIKNNDKLKQPNFIKSQLSRYIRMKRVLLVLNTLKELLE